jgi:hypothetical protein
MREAGIVRRPFGSAPQLLSVLLVVDAIVATVAALARPDLIHGPAVSVGSLRGTALVVLVVALPVLVASMLAVGRGSLLALVGWLGALGYVAYQGVLFLFGSPFNGLFFFCLGLLSFGIWALIALVPRLPVAEFAAMFGPRTPVRAIAAYLVILTGAFYVLWLKAIVPALFDSESPAFLEGTGMITGPGQIIDLGFALPLTLLAAVTIWQRRPCGYLLGGTMLVMLGIESISIGVDQWFGSVADPSSPVVSATLVPVFVVIAAIDFSLLGLFVRSVQARAASRVLRIPGSAE